ncbi:MAG: hypothetical protein EWV92_03185 [Microcystis aeruginosa Ma_MB_S_20031200_S102]|uniref:Uncharacterized protein n=1 Tax=Microcystis aeruginosa Ma_MB_S_20031200_S102 TaxID=2486254 RepID=A0A552F488_MICAE|nr:MAG: hypothetical protein EWV92_03185 [Microcystis aeruginosa Ma_MB_S_20031200_S102]
MNANCASYLKVSLGLGLKNPTREDSALKSATPADFLLIVFLISSGVIPFFFVRRRYLTPLSPSGLSISQIFLKTPL